MFPITEVIIIKLSAQHIKNIFWYFYSIIKVSAIVKCVLRGFQLFSMHYLKKNVCIFSHGHMWNRLLFAISKINSWYYLSLETLFLTHEVLKLNEQTKYWRYFRPL